MNCGLPVRGGVEPFDECGLEALHKGYHAGVTFTCDACGNTYRGAPYRTSRESQYEDSDGLGFCFLCVKTWERTPYEGYGE